MSTNEAKKAFKQALDFAEKNQAQEKVCLYIGLHELAEAINNIEHDLKKLADAVQVLKNH